jgi:hypothetical protein
VKKARNILKFYFFGIIISLFIIGLLYLYSYFFEPHFRYAQWSNMIQTITISGIPFGLGIWGFTKIKYKKKLDWVNNISQL